MPRSLAEKLGYKPGMTVRVEGAPEGLALDLPARQEGSPDLLLVFVPDAAAIADRAESAAAAYPDGARLWFAYPKRTGAIRTDINRDVGWEPLTRLGLLPVTQIALDATWSALRFRRRHEIAQLTRQF